MGLLGQLLQVGLLAREHRKRQLQHHRRRSPTTDPQARLRLEDPQERARHNPQPPRRGLTMGLLGQLLLAGLQAQAAQHQHQHQPHSGPTMAPQAQLRQAAPLGQARRRSPLVGAVTWTPLT